MQRQFSSGSRQAPDPYDQFLEENNYYRKHTARDSSCLFRVISEQLYDTQLHHAQIRKMCVRYMRKNRSRYECLVDRDFDEYLDDLSKPKTYATLLELQAIGMMFGRNVVLFEAFNLGSYFYQRPDLTEHFCVFYTHERHFDSVFTCEYIKDAAICQSICYEFLYKDLFKLPDVSYAVEYMLHVQSFEKNGILTETNAYGYCTRVYLPDGREFLLDLPHDTNCILENYKLCHFHYDDFPSFTNDLGRELTTCNKPHNDDYDKNVALCKTAESLLPAKHISCVRQLLAEGITPFPYKVAKALDPHMYRNIEFDAWNEARKEARMQQWYNGDNNFKVGAKCLVQLHKSQSDLYPCHIQEIATDKGYCIVFIEQLGEKRVVPYDSLSPLPPDQFKPWALPYRIQRHMQKYASYRVSRHLSHRYNPGEHAQYSHRELCGVPALPAITAGEGKAASFCGPVDEDDLKPYNGAAAANCYYKLNTYTHFDNFRAHALEYCTMPLTVTTDVPEGKAGGPSGGGGSGDASGRRPSRDATQTPSTQQPAGCEATAAANGGGADGGGVSGNGPTHEAPEHTAGVQLQPTAAPYDQYAPYAGAPHEVYPTIVEDPNLGPIVADFGGYYPMPYYPAAGGPEEYYDTTMGQAIIPHNSGGATYYYMYNQMSAAYPAVSATRHGMYAPQMPTAAGAVHAAQPNVAMPASTYYQPPYYAGAAATNMPPMATATVVPGSTGVVRGPPGPGGVYNNASPMPRATRAPTASWHYGQVAPHNAAGHTPRTPQVGGGGGGGRVNYDVRKSHRANGSDLPTDAATLRYFFNLGLECMNSHKKHATSAVQTAEGSAAAETTICGGHNKNNNNEEELAATGVETSEGGVTNLIPDLKTMKLDEQAPSSRAPSPDSNNNVPAPANTQHTTKQQQGGGGGGGGYLGRRYHTRNYSNSSYNNKSGGNRGGYNSQYRGGGAEHANSRNHNNNNNEYNRNLAGGGVGSKGGVSALHQNTPNSSRHLDKQQQGLQQPGGRVSAHQQQQGGGGGASNSGGGGGDADAAHNSPMPPGSFTDGGDSGGNMVSQVPQAGGGMPHPPYPSPYDFAGAVDMSAIPQPAICGNAGTAGGMFYPPAPYHNVYTAAPQAMPLPMAMHAPNTPSAGPSYATYNMTGQAGQYPMAGMAPPTAAPFNANFYNAAANGYLAAEQHDPGLRNDMCGTGGVSMGIPPTFPYPPPPTYYIPTQQAAGGPHNTMQVPPPQATVVQGANNGAQAVAAASGGNHDG